jgi:hypothetical protein
MRASITITTMCVQAACKAMAASISFLDAKPEMMASAPFIGTLDGPSPGMRAAHFR